ncbi:MAG: isoprenylcysteine carboxylmethyltransferase family protein [Candidatus Bathyarchaeia archaeon]
MQNENFIATFIALCLLTFYSINIYNLAKTKHERNRRKAQTKTQPSQETPSPKSLSFTLVIIGTSIFWLESITYPIIVYAGFSSLLNVYPLQLSIPNATAIQSLGIILTSIGYFLFIWSILARGKYATSWEVSQNHKLVTWGPYRYVRHPSYLAYFLLFFGLFLMTINILTLPCLIAIPGYYKVAEKEEEMLLERFSEEYREYQRKTGRFLPHILRKETANFENASNY